MYWVYDIFVDTELITDVPQDFLIGLEKYADENDIE
jgi:hypothetical protein